MEIQQIALMKQRQKSLEKPSRSGNIPGEKTELMCMVLDTVGRDSLSGDSTSSGQTCGTTTGSAIEQGVAMFTALDVSEQVPDILKQEGKEPEVIIYIGTNDRGSKKEEVLQRQFRELDRTGRETKGVGEIALLIRDHITVVLREDTLEGSCNEALWVELRNRKGVITMLGVFCRPPYSPRETEEQICSQILEKCENSRVVVVGNFNFPLIDWDSLRARGSDGEQFVSCVQEGFLR
eukprot:g32448.t1